MIKTDKKIWNLRRGITNKKIADNHKIIWIGVCLIIFPLCCCRQRMVFVLAGFLFIRWCADGLHNEGDLFLLFLSFIVSYKSDIGLFFSLFWLRILVGPIFEFNCLKKSPQPHHVTNPHFISQILRVLRPLLLFL